MVTGLLLLFSCEEIVQRPVADPSTPRLVVEAVLSNERINHRVKLSSSATQLNAIASPVAGAVVAIHGGGSSVVLTETPAGSGEYYTPLMRFESGTVFTLEVRYQGVSYVASDSSIPVELLTPLEYERAGDGYRLVPRNNGVTPNYIAHALDWSATSSCTQGDCKGKVVFYDLKTIEVNEITKPQKEEFLFPAGTVVVRKRFSVSPPYRAFLRSVLSETEWRGSAFDVERGNAPTNLSGGALGFFAVTSVVTDTTLVVAKP